MTCEQKLDAIKTNTDNLTTKLQTLETNLGFFTSDYSLKSYISDTNKLLVGLYEKIGIEKPTNLTTI